MQRILPIVLLVLGLVATARAADLAALRELAEQGDSRVQFVLGALYRDGQGVAQDVEEMFRLWHMAAEQGSFEAQFALGDLYSGGYGIAKDNVLAYMWFDILATQAKETFIGRIAARNRNAVTSFMTAAEIARAGKLAADWQAKHAKP